VPGARGRLRPAGGRRVAVPVRRGVLRVRRSGQCGSHPSRAAQTSLTPPQPRTAKRR